MSWGGNAASTNTVTWNSWSNKELNHNIEDQNEVLSLMNNEAAGSWKLVDDMAVPVLSGISIPSQGTSALAMTPEKLRTALGENQWMVVGEMVEPAVVQVHFHAAFPVNSITRVGDDIDAPRASA